MMIRDSGLLFCATVYARHSAAKHDISKHSGPLSFFMLVVV